MGDKWLVEARGTIGELIFQENGNSGPWHSSTFTSVDFLQVDYVANSHLTITAGYFLTPFGFYNERLSPIWIKNFQDPPIIGAIGTQTSGSSTGGMLRGVAVARDHELRPGVDQRLCLAAAERGRPSIIDNSPTMEPGPMKAKMRSVPERDIMLTFSKPSSIR